MQRELRRGLSDQVKAVLFMCAMVIGVAQTIATLDGRDHWPLCSYDMFSRVPRQEQTIVKVSLIDDRSSIIVPPGRLLPEEFFKANSLVRQAFEENNDYQTKTIASEAIVDELKNYRWDGFDEILRPELPSNANSLRGFEVLEYRVTFCADSHCVYAISRPAVIWSWRAPNN